MFKIPKAKKATLVLSLFIIASIELRGFIYRHFVTYKTIEHNETYSITDKKLKEYIDKNLQQDTSIEIKEIISILS